MRNRREQFVIDSEAVILGVDGASDFNALHSGKQNADVQLYAFDIMALEGDDLRRLPCRRARRASRDCWHGGRTASSSRRPSKARSDQSYSAPHAAWGWRAGFEN
jgi:ATP-dependent DNA ligase